MNEFFPTAMSLAQSKRTAVVYRRYGKSFEHETLFQSKLQLFYDSDPESPSAVYRVPE